MTDAPKNPATLLAQAMHFIDPTTGGISPPIHMASTYARDGDYQPIGDAVYARDHNPTFKDVERVIAALDAPGIEKAESLTFASGMAAVAAVLETVPAGKRIAAPSVLYHGAREWLIRLSKSRNVGVDFFDATQPGALEAAITPGQTDLVWIEPIVNPTWDVIDIEAAAAAAHAAGAVLAVDATCTPALTTRPLALGADITFQSATKYLGGHSDLIAGVLTTADRDSARWQEVRFVRTLGGAILGPMEAWLLLRGMRTLALRWERACQNSQAIAQHFEGHPQVEKVLYPGLPAHPGHAIAARQMTGGFGGMLSLCVAGGFAGAKRVATSTKVLIPATSLGGVESLIEHRKAIEPPNSPVPENLLRLSIGIEAVEDLIADLEAALSI
jgi:cystathionine gamma-synthase